MRNFTDITINKVNYSYMEFNSLDDYKNIIDENKWHYTEVPNDSSYTDSWTYGESFPSQGEHHRDLINGQASKLMIESYYETRNKIQNMLNVSSFYRQGLSCLRQRRYTDDGDDLDIDRFLGGTDNYWISHKRNKKAKNIRIAMNFGLNSNNNEINFAKLVGVLGALADMLTKLGYATEILGCNYRRYRGSKKLGYTSSIITFKKAGEKLDLQRLLSMGLQGLLRDWEFGIGEELGYDGSQGSQSRMGEEFKKHMNINYVIEQAETKTDKDILNYFENVINQLVEHKGEV